jgi:hypothetical protein
MTSAVSRNTSFNIQNQTIQVLSGNATNQDKYQYIVSAYQRAASIGDVTLAQSLEAQAYTLSQTMQYEAQQAATARQTLASASASGQQNVASSLTFALKQLNVDIQGSGQKSMNSTLQAWVKANSGTLQKLGVKLPAGAQPNYFDLVNAVGGAIYNAHMLAYQAELPYNPAAAQTYYDQAMSLKLGISKLPTLAGELSASQIQNAAASNAEFAYDQASGKLLQTKQTGFSGYDENGQPIATYSGSIKQTVFLTPQQTGLMTKLGLNFSENKDGTTGNGVQVQGTQNTPDWLRKILGPNGVTNIFSTNQGLVFEADDTKGGKAYYTLASDSRGLVGLYENKADGGVQALGGEYGFNQGSNSITSLINNAQAVNHTITLQKQAEAAALAAATPKALPTINLNPSPAAAAPVAPPVSIQAPQTVSVLQNANGNPQGNNAGYGINNTGGKGVAITGTTNKPVGVATFHL